VAGICYGGRLALELVKDRRGVGAVCLAPPIIRLGTWTRGRRLMKGWRIVSFIRSNPFLRAVLLRPLRKLLVERKASARVAEAMKEIDHARVLFLFSETEVSRDHYRERATRRLEELSATLSAEQSGRWSVQLTPTGPLTGFDLLSGSEQNLILDTITDWLTASFDGAEKLPERFSSADAIREPEALAVD